MDFNQVTFRRGLLEIQSRYNVSLEDVSALKLSHEKAIKVNIPDHLPENVKYDVLRLFDRVATASWKPNIFFTIAIGTILFIFSIYLLG